MALKKWAANVRDANVGPQKSRRKCPILAGVANVRAANFVSVLLFLLLALLYGFSCIQLTAFTQKGQLVQLMVGLSFQLLGLLSWKFSPPLRPCTVSAVVGSLRLIPLLPLVSAFKWRALSKLEEMTIPLQVLLDNDDNATWLSKTITDMAKAHPSIELLQIDGDKQMNKTHWPPLGIGALISRNQSNGKLNVQLLFNGATYHGPEIALNLLGNAMLGNATSIIQPSIELYGEDENPFGMLKDLFKDVIGNMGAAMSVITAFSIMTATMVGDGRRTDGWGMDGHSMEKNDNWETGDQYAIPIKYGTALLKLNAGAIGERTALLLNVLLGIVLPTKALSGCILNLALIATYQQLIGQHFDDGSGNSFFGDAGPVGELWKEFRRELYAMGIAGLIFWVLLALLHSRRVAWAWHKMSNNIAMVIYGNRSLSEEDEDVREERDRMLRETNESHALAVMGLTKFYRRFCAVREITFGVKAEECFGLLGVNGAGKTTTFDLLAGVQYASGGSATVAGRYVKKCPRIGYCPQFDALPGELTGREVLTLLMRLNGFRDSGERARKTLWAIRMESNADKQTKQFSGGQRVGVAVAVHL
ncbi:hypothetical protein niasHT_000369 [Heterodera trifolii]|uniref:ABC transporter domain-containing protein n=1 Tax=Heterodera trifolii TaxID=157864 RepID=A0ABD2MDF4_9BILA